MFNIILLGFTSLCTDISSEMVYPLIPLFLASVGAGPAALGLIEGFAESLASLLKVYSGSLADRVGKRKGLTLAGYLASALGKVILALASGWGTVLCARSVDRIGKGIRTAPRDALIAESAAEGKRGRAFGLHRGMDTAGAVIGVGAAWFILAGGVADYPKVFLYSIFPALLGVVLLFWLREPPRAVRKERGRPSFNLRILPGSLRRFLGIILVFSLGNSSNAFLLLRSAGPARGPAGVLLLYLAYNVSYMVLSYPAGRLSDRFGRKRILALGYTVYGCVYFAFAAFDPSQSAWIPWVLFTLYGAYSGLTDGVEKALVTDLAPQPIRAGAIGLHAMITGIGLFPASVIAGLLWEHFGPSSPFLLGGALGLGAAAGIALFLRDGTSTPAPAL